MNFLTRLAVAALALVLASPSIAANDVVYINGLPLFVSTINSGAVQAVAVYAPANAPLSVAQRGGFASAGAGQYGVGLTSATSLTVPTGATIAQICVAGGTANYRDDGTAPTASVGIPWGAGCAAYGGPLATVQFINQTGSTATLSVSYYK